MRLRWIDVACVEVVTDGGVRLLVDPYVDSCPWNAGVRVADIGHVDYVLVSHTHFDHVAQLNELFERDRPRIVCGKLAGLRLLHDLDLSGQCVYGAEDGQAFEFEGLRVMRLAGRHTVPGNSGQHLRRESEVMRGFEKNEGWPKEYLGMGSEGYYEFSNFYVETSDNTRLLFWGGSASADQLAHARARGLRPDITFAQVPGNSPKDLVNLARTVGGSYVVPNHHDVYLGKRDVAQMCDERREAFREVGLTTRFTPLEMGVWYCFKKSLQTL